MNDEHNHSNTLKTVHGNNFNKRLKTVLEQLKLEGFIRDFRTEPRYHHAGFVNYQYKPDAEILLSNETYVIVDNTTTMRNDRLKTKQWDAHGIKSFFHSIRKPCYYFIIVPNDHEIGSEGTRKKEIHNVKLAKEKTNIDAYFSSVDDVFCFDELVSFLKSPI